MKSILKLTNSIPRNGISQTMQESLYGSRLSVTPHFYNVQNCRLFSSKPSSSDGSDDKVKPKRGRPSTKFERRSSSTLSSTNNTDNITNINNNNNIVIEDQQQQQQNQDLLKTDISTSTLTQPPTTTTSTTTKSTSNKAINDNGNTSQQQQQPKDSLKNTDGIALNFKMPDQRPRMVSVSDDIMGEDSLQPKEIVTELDRYIIGQAEAKRAVSIALRNRWRRKRLDSSIKHDVYPKNILMIGPTGVGKTEIARRLAKIVNAPFVKVEATKYTEVGFHGPDVDSIIRDLVEVSINNIKSKIGSTHKQQIDQEIEKEIISSLVGPTFQDRSYDDLVKEKCLENIQIELDLPSNNDSKSVDEEIIPFAKLFNIQVEVNKPTKKKTLTVAEARNTLEKIYKDKVIVAQDVTKLAVQSAEQNGIVFLDEIDKICTVKESSHRGGDASTDGVQRDLLPIIEGCNVNTKYGNVDTSRILFIASGAFHSNKPSDLISELQGRLPIRVELKPLEQHDFFRILTEPKNNQIQQQVALLKTEDIDLEFTQDALQEIARIAFEANAQVQNIGARRLHGVIEKIVEDISFNCDTHKGQKVTITVDDVKKHLSDLMLKTDLSKYII
ncbi:Heat shock protein HslVU [Heterostelium album PN500]|uniref:Heat shock protein HslVU n=1 Tax=Heterostelium pallidum (strain ATCC 26659 / Pp 5 / PN500) TaxID=670386 RepID=D3AZX3_HETP5|nr:Heat shock protein HslVU [Heterostelium album PN500]EFA84597.1 Heat shock protein HslVU [Heterostelium album PN500]|eukprot:XP_020436710.1 Heat shock protein HslVU [Heterostelium album PN500]